MFKTTAGKDFTYQQFDNSLLVVPGFQFPNQTFCLCPSGGPSWRNCSGVVGPWGFLSETGQVCSDLFPIEAGVDEMFSLLLLQRSQSFLHTSCCIVYTQNQNLSLARAVLPELCLACLFSVVKYLSISWCQLLNPKGLWSLLNKIQSCHLLLNPRIIITCFMGFLSTAYFGLWVLKHFHNTSSAPDFANS